MGRGNTGNADCRAPEMRSTDDFDLHFVICQENVSGPNVFLDGRHGGFHLRRLHQKVKHSHVNRLCLAAAGISGRTGVFFRRSLQNNRH